MLSSSKPALTWLGIVFVRLLLYYLRSIEVIFLPITSVLNIVSNPIFTTERILSAYSVGRPAIPFTFNLIFSFRDDFLS